MNETNENDVTVIKSGRKINMYVCTSETIRFWWVDTREYRKKKYHVNKKIDKIESAINHDVPKKKFNCNSSPIKMKNQRI